MPATANLYEVDFYADGFRHVQLLIDDEAQRMSPCTCVLWGRQGHSCERGKAVERVLAKMLQEKGISAYPEVITCRKI